ncbi:hypothetical protein CKAH01_05902 [Colletotrichum kahawae]|uniref:Uncharacterized protein n=1 Tax=Colletotrichum kahawae TaxID=34407 RepID=A0AAE0D6J9_COLKA|nr:hypothetical protein CKAH01_05902 [Colletotrichum kahawae]
MPDCSTDAGRKLNPSRFVPPFCILAFAENLTPINNAIPTFLDDPPALLPHKPCDSCGDAREKCMLVYCGLGTETGSFNLFYVCFSLAAVHDDMEIS